MKRQSAAGPVEIGARADAGRARRSRAGLGPAAGASLLFALAGCGSGNTTGDATSSAADGGAAVGGAATAVCVPGETRECVGPGACRGGQACARDGASWGACDCGEATGGAAGAPGTGGDATSGGAAGASSVPGTGGAAGAATAPQGGGAAIGGAATSGAAPEAGAETGAGTAGAPDGSGGAAGAAGSGGATGAAGGGAAGGGGAFVPCDVGDGMVTLRVIYRDFTMDHPDFEPAVSGTEAATPGLVGGELGEDGLPVLVGTDPTITSAETFAQWFTDVPGVNGTIAGELPLYNTEHGDFVNRWDDGGAPWVAYEDVTWCGRVGEACSSCSELAEGARCYDPCPVPAYDCSCSAIAASYDGTPTFFPIDGEPGAITSEDELEAATIAPAYGGAWELEPGEPRHNFHFTSELRFTFVYGAATSYAIEVTGDDDIWVFVNGRLAIDLGGVHTPVSQQVNLDGATYGLVDGERYEVALFHAERQTTGSTLRLSLSGFGWSGATCLVP